MLLVDSIIATSYSMDYFLQGAEGERGNPGHPGPAGPFVSNHVLNVMRRVSNDCNNLIIN